MTGEKMTDDSQRVQQTGKIQAAVSRIEALRQNSTLPRQTIHDINNSLAKITNALWLLDFESDPHSANAQEYNQLIQKELDSAFAMLKE